MTTYEYEYVLLELSDEQKQMIQMGIGNIDHLNDLVRDAINKRAADGWEPLYPFSVPAIWLRREVKTRKSGLKTRKA